MKKFVFTAIIALFVAAEANAQFKIGVKGGWDFENFDIGGSIGKQLRKENHVSWDLGLVVQAHLAGNFYLQPEALYSSRKIDIADRMFETNSAKVKLAYIQVPINVMYKFKFLITEPFIFGGPYIGYAVNRNNYAKEAIKKNDWGLNAGVGIDFLRFQVSAKYSWALKNISDAENIRWKNNLFTVSVAFFIF